MEQYNNFNVIFKNSKYVTYELYFFISECTVLLVYNFKNNARLWKKYKGVECNKTYLKNIIARMPIIVNDRLSSFLFLYYFPDILIIMVVTEGDAMYCTI